MSEAQAPEPPAGSDRTPAEQRNLRFNFSLLVVHGLLGQTGFRLVQAPTFLPHFVGLIAGNASAVGILRAVQSFGMFLSPILSARIVERRARAKWLGVLFGGAMRLQVLFLALVALLVPAEHALPLIWLAVGLLGLALGMQGVVFQFVISKTIPVARRGVLLGLRTSAAGVALLGVAFVGGYLVEGAGFPAGYGYTFLLGFVLTSLGLVAFAFLREPDSSEVHEGTPLGARLRTLPALLRGEPDFRRFIVARFLGTASRGAMPMYILFIGRELSISGEQLGLYSATFFVANSFSGLGWGLLADRIGFKGVFQAALLTWAAGSALIILAPVSTLAYAGIYVLVGAGVSGFMLAGQNLVLEFGTQRDRPMRIAISNSGSEFVGTFGFLAAGLLADLATLELVFVLSIACQLGAILLMRRVREPRVRVAPTIDAES
jgi:MFS family permease